MTGRGRNANTRIETDIEKCREDSNWKKVIELAEQLKVRSPNCECLSNFLMGEGKLESYLEEYPPLEGNYSRARGGLGEAETHLLMAASEAGRRAGVALDAHLLLGKLHYASGMFEESLKNYTLAELHTLTEKHLPLRSLRIVAESYAIKGLCLEHSATPGGSRYKQVERENEMAIIPTLGNSLYSLLKYLIKNGIEKIRCFELASELSLLYIQRAESASNTGSSVSVVATGAQTGSSTISGGASSSGGGITRVLGPVLGPVLETALQRAPILHMRASRLQQAVDRYREMLTAVESQGTHSLRLTLARQLAEVLLRGVSGSQWTPSNIKTPVDGPWKPKKYAGLNQFVPNNECEETILLLQIGEAMAVRDAVLSQSPEFKQARIHAFENASAIYDLLTIATVRWGQVGLLQESLERAMKFSFEEAHVWQQQAYSLVTLGRGERAVRVLAQVIELEPDAVVPCLLAARQCYENLNRIADGLRFSKMALEREHSHPSYMLSRCHLYVGIGYLMTARATTVRAEKEEANARCMESFHKAVDCDPEDHLCLYYLALQYALMGGISEAMYYVRLCLTKRPECSAAMQLLCLVLSAKGRSKEALATANAALEDHPDSMDLLRVLALLQLRCQGGEAALVTGKHMLSLWKNLYENTSGNEAADKDFDRKSETRSVLQFYNDLESVKDSGSLQANSQAASRAERALSSAASQSGSLPGGAVGSGTPMGGPLIRLRLWLLLAEVYLALGGATEAAACVDEAATIFPLSHQLIYMRGMVHCHKQEWAEAKQCFLNAIAINPSHVDSLVQLGLCYHHLGSHRLAEKTLKDAAKIEPGNHNTWYSLGLVVGSLGEHDTASDCMATALNVELSSPVLPFTSISYIFE